MAHQKTLPRGVRNNNPLNIRESKGDTTQWKGEALLDSDKAFEEFKNPAFGFRAGARVLRSYERQGFCTLSEMINRFAPDHENDTDHYIKFVSQKTGITPNQRVNVNDNDELAKLLHAMSRLEVGNYYTLEMAQKGVAMA
ncbi:MULTISPECIES: virion protein [unclassified Vibrio]|uniref:virion protein n=1 Tax=unclassified Vibrio TaxID=2614977 RepID=UPI00352D2F9F